MKSKKSLLLIFVFILFFAGCSMQANDFSAQVISKSGRDTLSGKVNVSGNKVRMEMPGFISITRPDKSLVWVLMPADKMFLEQRLDNRSLIASGVKTEGQTERVLIGAETVDGKAAQKYKVTHSFKGRKDSFYQWIVSGLRMPVKTSSLDGSWFMEYRAIRTGAQPASLFEVPAGYKKFSQKIPSVKEMIGSEAESLF